MTATDELRRMLDERGVEWRKPAKEYWVLLGMPEGDSATIVGELSIEEATDGTLVAYNLTPAQAIAATLGRGTCHITPKFTCSECGHQYPTRNYESYETCDGRTAFAPLGYNVLDCKKPNFCPNCGRKVVDE